MKMQNKLFLYFLLCLLMSSLINAQSIDVQNLLGKKTNEVIKKYGTPVHKDDSNPSMICMFYKNKTTNMIFVSGESGVYQAEATKIFDTESEARSNIDEFISGSIANGFSVDTLSISDFRLNKTGAKVDLQLSENKINKNFEIKVKANKTES